MIHLVVNGAAGRMGARTCAVANTDPRFQLVARIDRDGNVNTPPRAAATVDVVIDFSSDRGASAALDLAVKHGASIIVGTTGLSRQTLADAELASQSVAVMIAPNTSPGVAVMNHLVAEAARMLGSRYDIDLIDVHHSAKDVLETVHPRELELGTIVMALFAYLVAEEGF